jgi:diguanylate cyclase (GGDEF)-like protein
MENNKFNILIVDDEQVNIELAAAFLQEEGYKISFALNAKASLEVVMKKKIDLILLDINMPQTDGFQVCQMLKESQETKDIPIIFLTAQTDITYVSKAFEVGGVDYISKPFNGVELIARVKTHLQIVTYLNEIKEKQNKLAQLSITDHLTKLHNNMYFDSKIKTKLNKNEKFWSLYIRINNFERVNRLYGFDKANIILKVFSKILLESTPKKSVVARLYGASFGILLKDYDKATIESLAKNLTKKFNSNKELNKSINFSIVAHNIKDDSSISSIYRKLLTGIDNKKDINSLFID